MADAQALTTEDYAALHALQMSSDPAQQAQAAALAKKLTPPEQQAFFDYQKTQHPQGEHGRVDNQVLGLPPELAALAVGPIVKAATTAGITTGQRIGAAFKSALGQAHPLVKYEITRSALEHLGIPGPLAMGVAIAVSGYKTGGAPATATEAATELAPAAADATSAAAPVSSATATSAAPEAIAAAAPYSYSKAVEDVRAAFKALGKEPGPADLNNAASMMKFGKSATEAVARVVSQRAPTVADVAAKLAERFGLPNDATVAARVAARNATGRWQP